MRADKACAPINPDDMLAAWHVLSGQLLELRMDVKNPDLAKAFQLLIEDCLLDSRVYEGTDFQLHYDSGKVPLAHRNAVQRWSVQQDIKDIDLAVERSLQLDEYYIMAGGEPVVTPDDYPALPQSEMAATSSIGEASMASYVYEGVPEPREPISSRLPPGKSYQKVYFNPADGYYYRMVPQGGSATDHSNSTVAPSLSFGDVGISPSSIPSRPRQKSRRPRKPRRKPIPRPELESCAPQLPRVSKRI